jgi:hypothetical protein
MSYNLKITIYNNRDYEQEFTLTEEDESPLDLTGYKVSFAVGSIHTDRPLIHHVSGTSGNQCVFIDSAINGQIRLVLPYAVMRVLDAGTYIHDCILIAPDGKRTGVWSGNMIVKKGVS